MPSENVCATLDSRYVNIVSTHNNGWLGWYNNVAVTFVTIKQQINTLTLIHLLGFEIKIKLDNIQLNSAAYFDVRMWWMCDCVCWSIYSVGMLIIWNYAACECSTTALRYHFCSFAVTQADGDVRLIGVCSFEARTSQWWESLGQTNESDVIHTHNVIGGLSL